MIFGESAVGEVDLAYVSRGSKSRNKVSVGEPAEGSVLRYFVIGNRPEEAFGWTLPGEAFAVTPTLLR